MVDQRNSNEDKGKEPAPLTDIQVKYAQKRFEQIYVLFTWKTLALWILGIAGPGIVTGVSAYARATAALGHENIKAAKENAEKGKDFLVELNKSQKRVEELERLGSV